MATYGDLKSEIASEIERDDLDTQIGYAVLDALRSLSTKKTTFNSDVDTSLSTTADSNLMALPANAFAVKSITLDVGDYKQPLESWAYPEIVEASTDENFSDEPIAFAVFDGQIYFDVLADAVYPAVVSFWKTFDLPTADSNTHAWITNAYTCVKYEAKKFLYASSLFDNASAAGFGTLAKEDLGRIQAQLTLQTDSNQASLRR